MRSIRLFASLIALGPVLLPPGAAAQAGKAAAKPDVKTWTTPFDPASRPRDAFVDGQGRVWFVGQEGNYVAYLDPERSDFKRYEIEPGTNPHNLVVDAKGMVWFTGNRNGRIVRLDPATGKLTNFPMPDASVRDPHTMTFDAHGDAWFTAQNAGYVGKLTGSTGAIRLWKMESGSRPYGIVLDSRGRPYFDLFGTNKIGTIDPQTGAFRAYTLPNDRARPRRIAITNDETIWYGDFTRGYLGRLNPRTGATEEFLLPGGAASLPYGMTTDDRGRVWLAETGSQPNRLVAFDPKAKRWVETIPIPANGPNSIRHMVFDKTSRQIWFGADANMIGRVTVAPEPVVP